MKTFLRISLSLVVLFVLMSFPCFGAEQPMQDVDSISPSKASQIELNVEERHWLDAHPAIRMCVDPAWMPFEQINKGGK